MITFKQFLIEARMAPLYHTTTIDNFYHILRSQEIQARTNHAGKSANGVSLTRSIQTAFKWKQYYTTIVIEIDQQKLIQNKRVKPINIAYTWSPATTPHAKYEELFEEYVEGPIPSKYFKRFIVKSQNLGDKMDFEDARKALRNIYNAFPNIDIFVWDTKKTIKPGKLELG